MVFQHYIEQQHVDYRVYYAALRRRAINECHKMTKVLNERIKVLSTSITKHMIPHDKRKMVCTITQKHVQVIVNTIVISQRRSRCSNTKLH